MNSFPRIRSFKVRLDGGETIREQADNLQVLDNCIQISGLDNIMKIQFYFESPVNTKIKIILGNITDSNGHFSVRFINYDTHHNQSIGMSLEQKLICFSAMLVTLHTIGNLDSNLIPYINTPFEEIDQD